MTKKQQEIIEKNWINPLSIANTGKQPKAIAQMMDEWGVNIFKYLETNGIDFTCEPPTKTSAKEFYDEIKNKIV